MKRLNFNIKDRKVLTLGLCLILVCVFTLTIAYAALNAVLTIQGSAQVTSADWDIHLANPKVTNGSATINVPQIKTNSTMEFSTTLNMPGDFYEFTVDVVNSGSIDAMIENVIKNPELDASQKKYLNYEVTYQNGESITTKQTLSKGTTMPIKVRIEYRKDLVASDLPTGQVVLDLSLTLEYIQSDGTGTSVPNNGVGGSNISANGSLDAIGTIVTIGDQQFYTIGTEGDNVKLLSMMNITISDKPVQNSNINPSAYSSVGVEYSGSNAEVYVNNYKTSLENDYGLNIIEARLITIDELVNDKIGCNEENRTCIDAPEFIYSTSYWVGSASDTPDFVWYVFSDGHIGGSGYSNRRSQGIRPVIVISKSLF